MGYLNRWTGLGNLGQAPVLRKTQKGDSVCNLSIACSKFLPKRTQTGEPVLDEKGAQAFHQDTQWVKATCWGQLAETVSERCTSGTQVYVEGELRSRKYTNQKGIEVVDFYIEARRVVPLTRLRSSEAEVEGVDLSGDEEQSAEVPF